MATARTGRDHVFTLYPYHDVVVRDGRGCWIEDTDGRRYLDLAAGQLCASLGHAHPRIVEVARAQAARVVNLGNRFFGEASLDACREIAGVCPPGLDKVVLCSTGSEANELAFRIARAATGHHELVGVRKGYYGATHETLSLSDYVGFIKGLGTRSPGVHRLPCPECARCPVGRAPDTCEARCVGVGAEQLRDDSTGAIAAFIVEPVLGSGGVIVPPPAFFRGVRALADRYGALLVADEAQTGLGRTGRWMGMEHAGVAPDVCVLSKGLGAGFPVAAVVTTAEIEARCLAAPLANMSSHSFDPFGGAVAAEVIRTIRDEGLVAHADAMGRLMREHLVALGRRHPTLANVRGLGLMIGVDVVDPATGERDPLRALMLEAECLHQGLVVGYSALSGVLRVLPPLVITPAEIEEAVSRLDAACAHLAAYGMDPARYLPKHPGSLKLAMRFLGTIGRR